MLSSVWLFATPWTAAYQAPLSMGFSRQEYWSGVPSPSPLRLDISYKEKNCKKHTKKWRLNNTFLNNQQVTEEIKREIKKISRNKWQWKHDNSNPMGCSKSSSKREVYSSIILPQERRKTMNRQPNFTPKTTGKRRTKKKPKLVEEKIS